MDENSRLWTRRNAVRTGAALAASSVVGKVSASRSKPAVLRGSYTSPLTKGEINEARDRVVDRPTEAWSSRRPTEIDVNSDSARIVSYVAVPDSSGIVQQHIGLAATRPSVASAHSTAESRCHEFESTDTVTTSSSDWLTNDYYTVTTEAGSNGAIDSVHRFMRSRDDPDIFVLHDSKDWQPGSVRHGNSGTNETGESKVRWGDGTDAAHEFEMVDYEPRSVTGDYTVSLQASSSGSVSYGISRQLRDVEIYNRSIRNWNLTNHELTFQGDGRTNTDGFDPGSMAVLKSYSSANRGLAVRSYMEGMFDRNWPYSEQTADHEISITM